MKVDTYSKLRHAGFKPSITIVGDVKNPNLEKCVEYNGCKVKLVVCADITYLFTRHDTWHRNKPSEERRIAKGFWHNLIEIMDALENRISKENFDKLFYAS